jgi:hypothetical protein
MANPKYLAQYGPVEAPTPDLEAQAVMEDDLKAILTPADPAWAKMLKKDTDELAHKKARDTMEHMAKLERDLSWDKYPLSSQFITDFLEGGGKEWPCFDPLENEVVVYAVAPDDSACPTCGDTDISTQPSDFTTPDIFICNAEDHHFVTPLSLREWQKEIDLSARGGPYL